MGIEPLDLLLINPGGREKIYQELGLELTAVEPPLWCRLIGGYVRDRQFSVEILDSEAENMDANSIAKHVEERNPRLVGMVVFGHQPSASTQQMTGAGEACRAIKEVNEDRRIIIVGGHVSALPERTMADEAVDFACKGEGPETIVQLLQALEDDNCRFEGVQGLVWRKEDDAIINPPAPLIKDLDADLHGDVWDLLPVQKYRAHNWQCFGNLESRMPYASIYTSLGCPYKCSFCCINSPFDANRYRMRSPAAVVAEIKKLHDKYGVKTFKIVDEMFVLNDKHVRAICQGIIDTGLKGLNFWAYARVDTVTPDILKLMRDAGIQWIALGIESGSEHVRDGSDKALKENDIVNVVRMIQGAGIKVLGNYIFGLPDDDLQSMQATLDLALELNCEFSNFYSAMAYPGSPLHKTAELNNWPLPELWSGYSQHSYDCFPLATEKVGSDAVLKFRDEAFNTYFESKRYLDMVAQEFGKETRDHIVEMSSKRLRRKILEGQEELA